MGAPPTEGSSSKKGKGKKATVAPSTWQPPSVMGKTVIVKVQLPMGGGVGMAVYNKSREFTCQLLPDGQQQEYARLEKTIKEQGLMGLKGYFMAEIGKDTVRIKVTEILANQPW